MQVEADRDRGRKRRLEEQQRLCRRRLWRVRLPPLLQLRRRETIAADDRQICKQQRGAAAAVNMSGKPTGAAAAAPRRPAEDLVVLPSCAGAGVRG